MFFRKKEKDSGNPAKSHIPLNMQEYAIMHQQSDPDLRAAFVARYRFDGPDGKSTRIKDQYATIKDQFATIPPAKRYYRFDGPNGKSTRITRLRRR